MKQFRTIDQVLASPWGQPQEVSQQGTDRIYRSTRLEDAIYTDLRQEDTTLDAV